MAGLRVLGRSFRTVWANGKARVGVVLLAVFVLLALLAPVLAPHDPHDNGFGRNEGGSAAHLLGTTGAGEDVLSQLLYGARVSITVAFLAGGLSTVVAVLVGLSWGYLRSWLGDVVDFVVNLFLVVPGMPLMIIIAAYLQNGGLAMIILVVVVTGWAWGARVLRAQTRSLRSRDFVTAALFSGESVARVVFREILPNMTSMIAGSFFGAATAAVLSESSLSFLGLGDPGSVSWGSMLFWAQNSNALLTGQWVLLFAPGLCVALLATAMALVNFGVDGLSNPRLREGVGR
ncbi:ABC transporter permease [Amycolatopsis rhizosphaerae]|uniref:ABC transporter permease n=1 Tax=Amycolatopsis rhizosphaerae TaxID=2053003 RepID=A0A558BAD2_9PSEU|nr:ABC transporter permease [Amycolatopsis rhizosphaerae]TVT33468.1 ABC transporter permease [Amycolatopsis rhizosphaerae]